jgi:hypothetical protein
MNLYEVRIALNGDRGNTAVIRMYANNSYECQQLANAQYGQSNVISHHDITDNTQWENRG